MTPAELKTATLRKLKVAPAGTDPSAEDTATITAYYAGLHGMLLKKSLITWALTENIPTTCEQPIMSMLAAMSCDEFGVPEPRATQLKAEGLLDLPQISIAERQLRKALASKYVSHPLCSDYF